MEKLLDRGEVVGHELVAGELLMGDAGERKVLLDSYRLMNHVKSVPHGEVAEFVRIHQLHGRSIGWIDAHLLASALVAHALLWTADEQLGSLAKELGVAYLAA